MSRRAIGRGAGAALFAIMLILPAPAGLEGPAWRTAAVAVLMAVWWISEAIPIPATALLPLILFPVMGVATIGDAAAPFANPLIFLFLGGFLIAAAMQYWGLPRRVALRTIRVLGGKPRSIVGGIMLSCAFLSMWVSNTATALMMLPIGASVLALVPGGSDDAERQRLGTAIMLGIAYSCSIGGLGTLIGTPPNAFLAGFMLESYGIEIGFVQWMLLGVPLVAVGLPIAYLVLTRVAFPIGTAELTGGRELIRREVAALGPMSPAERRVMAVFVGTALLWVTRPVLTQWLPGISDAGIAMLAALVLFLVPSGDPERGGFLLDWRLAERTPWGVLVLFGGGLSLAAAFRSTGLDAWIGTGVGALHEWPLPLLIMVIVAVVIFLTELTSNTATAATFLPVLGSVAIGLGEAPMMLAVPAALAATSAFMLPVATPPNAIVYSSGEITIDQMARTGLILNIIFTLLISAAVWVLLPVVFGV